MKRYYIVKAPRTGALVLFYGTPDQVEWWYFLDRAKAICYADGIRVRYGMSFERYIWNVPPTTISVKKFNDVIKFIRGIHD